MSGRNYGLFEEYCMEDAERAIVIIGSAAGTGLVSITQNYNEGTSENTATYYIPENLTTVVVTGEVKSETKSVKYDIVDGEMIVNENGAYSIDTVSYENSAVQPYAFYGVTTITSVEFKNATEIPDYTFYGCNSLTSINIPTTVTEIGRDAFNLCRSLTSVTIPTGVTKMLLLLAKAHLTDVLQSVKTAKLQ